MSPLREIREENEFLDGIYGTIESPDSWPEVMSALSKWSGAPAMGVRFEYKQIGALAQSWVGLPDAFERLYVDGLWRSDPWAAAADAMPIGAVVTGHDELTRISPGISTAPFIQDLLRPLGFSDVVGVVVRRDPACLFTWSALYDGVSAALEAHLRRTFDLLTPHVTRAIQLGHRLTERERIAKLAGEVARFGVIVVDKQLRVVSANEHASSLLASGDAVQVTGGALKLREAVAQGRLLSVIQGEQTEEAIHLGATPQGTMVMSVRRLFGTESTVYRLLIVDTDDEGRWTGRVLENVYGLTAAEARLAAIVGRGLSPAQAATKLGVAVSTTRTQLLRVFEKMGVHRQTDLVRLVTRLSTLAAPG